MFPREQRGVDRHDQSNRKPRLRRRIAAHHGCGEPDSAPAPAEGMARKRKNAQASRRDDSAAFGLREDLRPTTNHEPSKP
ncbi:hypothetical protein EH244_17825 [Variovorax beijingensis]|uniref:Uncharacterized protein n=1 Tax=Variovorax beijingensis TaxID=2496117 RepID=A0A3P3EMB5_9BURK|nr:hypothetical protein EH244_17825 [Variovorax beijingensis]RSZ35642.1 hypothetical protein EJO66_16795 [Variovorax beijingensis]